MSEFKRRRGRPRKPRSCDWLDNPPEHIKNWEIESNIVEDDFKELSESYRREYVSEAVCAAYKEGRNTANKNRARLAEELRNTIYHGEKDLIDNLRLSSSNIAEKLCKVGRDYGLGQDALRKHIAKIRKKLARPNGLKNS